jgi:hypothetical protein
MLGEPTQIALGLALFKIGDEHFPRGAAALIYAKFQNFFGTRRTCHEG